MRLLGVLAVAALAAAAALPAAAGEPKKVIKPAVQARARAISLHLTDLPGANWSSSPPSSGGKSTPRCSSYNPDQSDLTENGDVDSPTFHRSDGSDVSSTVGIFVSEAQAKTAYDRVVRPALPRCIAEILRKSGAGTVTIRSVGAVAFPHFGKQSAAFRISLVVKSGKSKVPVALDVVTVNQRRVDVAFFFTGIGGGFAARFERQVVARVAARI